jgi:integrase
LFRHGLRISELVGLKWDAVLWNSRKINITRSKNGLSGVHPLQQDEYDKLLKLKGGMTSNFIFTSERGEKLKEQAITKLIQRLGQQSELGFPVHPHQLRHACGYHLANQGMTTRDIQAYLGHKNIQNTEKYTILSSERFDLFGWD